MAREIREFACTIPAGTPQAAPVTRDMSFPPRIVDEIDVRIPPGPNGQVGIQIANAGLAIIPVGGQSFIIGNDDRIVWPLTDYASSGSWQLIGYNNGQYDHTIYVTFKLSLVQATPAALIVAPLSVAELDQAPAPDLGALGVTP